MTENYTANQIREMVLHIEQCGLCSGPPDNKDQDIIQSCYDESEPPVELADYITSSHDPKVLAIFTSMREWEPYALPIPPFLSS